MARYLVTFYGVLSQEWHFVAITWSRVDAELIAAQWYKCEVFDLFEWMYV